ncbi:arylsulfotransferase family protein [uncultured Roseobacter sp.]|uniref:arylsulfotransferase family protein n=1 Tax=uncultured Roseobacter sp. TaxID=114847 RepID=UPI00261C93FA|nr:arylsulfotransferase family protein [uncultured Roseobacter sp.]
MLFAKIPVWLVLIIFMVLTTLGGLWAYAVFKHKVFPYKVMREIRDFVRGDEFDDATLWERFLALTGSENPFELEAGLETNAVDGQVALQTELTEGYYMLYGFFDQDGAPVPTVHLMDMQGAVARTWRFPVVGTSNSPRRITYTQDGVVVANTSGVLRAVDWCGTPLWTREAEGGIGYHHEIDPHQGELTLWRNDVVVSVDVQTGAAREHFALRDLVLANPDEPILSAMLLDSNAATFRYGAENENIRFSPLEQRAGARPVHTRDPYHANAALLNGGRTAAFPDDAVLISLRQVNMIAVVEGSTGRILWRSFFNRPHDPHWYRAGVSVYNNRSNFDHSLIDYQPFEGPREIRVGPEQYDWYRKVTGNHQLLPDGGIVFQGVPGQVVHVDAQGRVLSDIRSRFVMRNGYYLSAGQVAAFESACAN